MKTCNSCGTGNADDAKFCETCGMPFGEPAKTEEAASASEVEKFSEPVTEEPKTAEPAAAAAPVAAAAASDYQTQSSNAPKSDYYEEPKTYTGKAINGNAYGIEQRNIVVAILLSLVTCDIYFLYWIYKVNEELKQLSGDDTLQEGGIVILLWIVTCGFYGIYWNYKMGQAVDKIKGADDGNSSVLYLLLSIFGLGIVALALEQNEINQMVA